jgi:hypothetical protein
MTCERCGYNHITHAVLSTLTPTQWLVCDQCAEIAMRLHLPVRAVTPAEINRLTHPYDNAKKPNHE